MKIEVGARVRVLPKDFPPELHAAEEPFLIDTYVSKIEKNGRERLIDLNLDQPPYSFIYRTNALALRKGEDDNCRFMLIGLLTIPEDHPDKELM